MVRICHPAWIPTSGRCPRCDDQARLRVPNPGQGILALEEVCPATDRDRSNDRRTAVRWKGVNGTDMSTDEAASGEDATKDDATTADATSGDKTAAGDTAGATTAKTADNKTADADKTAALDKDADDKTVVSDKDADEKTVALDKDKKTVVSDKDADEKTVALDKGADAETVKLGKGAAPPPARSRSALASMRWPLVGVGAVLIVAVIAVVAGWFLADSRGRELDDRAAATKAACDFGYAFTNFSADKMDDYLRQVSEASTGEWKRWVDESGPQLKQAVLAKKIRSTANDVQCGYKTGDDSSAEVVLVIDQTFSSPDQPGATDRSTLAAVVDLQKSGDTWRVAKFDTPALTPLGK